MRVDQLPGCCSCYVLSCFHGDETIEEFSNALRDSVASNVPVFIASTSDDQKGTATALAKLGFSSTPARSSHGSGEYFTMWYKEFSEADVAYVRQHRKLKLP